MGYNTSMIVRNDSLHDIENDPNFGKSVADAIKQLSPSRHPNGVDVAGRGSATVIETHHADYTTVIAFGGNYASVVHDMCGYSHHKPEFKLRLLQELAADLGYRLVKKKPKPP